MTSTGTSTDRAADRAAVETLLGALADAWNAGDADAYGALFTADATYVNFMGQVARGSTEITEGHRWLFAKIPGSRMASGVKSDREIRFLNQDTAVVVGVGAGTTVSGSEPSADRASAVSFVAVRAAAGWRFAHFQNTRLQAPPTA